jgi:hypothetical protein
MAGQGDFDLTRLERMERRLQSLEDAEAIRNLKSRYAALCDDSYDADGIAALFTEDATWDPGAGSVRGPGRDPRLFPGRGGDLLFRDPLQPERPDLHGWRYGAGAVVPAYAVHGGRRKSRHVARQHRP